MRSRLLKALAFCSALAVFPALGGVEVDLAGLKVGSGKRLAVSAAGALEPAQLYDIRIAATGSGTGTLGEILGSGDLKTRLTPYIVDIPDPSHLTLLNVRGRLPITVKSVRGSTTLIGIPMDSGTLDLRASANLTFRVRNDGRLALKASSIGLVGIQSGTGRRVDGDWTISSGSISIDEAEASSEVPRVDLMAQYYAYQVLGNDFYTTQPFQTYVGVELRRGRKEVHYAVVQNDGPVADSFRISAETTSTGVSVKFLDGKNDVTSEVLGGTFTVNDLPSGAIRLLKVVFSKPRTAPSSASAQVSITGSRIVAPGTRDVVTFVTLSP